MRPLRNATVAICLLVAVACSSGSSVAQVKLDRSPRFPDVEGVVTRVSRQRITIGARQFRLSRSLQSFSTYDLSPALVLGRQGQYVQAGVKGDTVGWLAGIGVVVKPQGVVNYLGSLVRVQRGRLVFSDGTTLAYKKGLDVYVRGRVRAQIDATSHEVATLTPI